MRRDWGALALFGLSGASSMGLQIAWTQQAALALGADGAAVLAVVTAFFTGLAVGAWLFATPIERSARPGRWYAACEAVIAAWAALMAFAWPAAAATLQSMVGPDGGSLRQWTIAFAGTTLLLLPATAAMGATMPAMERALAAWRARDARVAPLYAANTLGAVAGVLLAALVLVPLAGLRATSLACAAVGSVVAVLAWRILEDTMPASRSMGEAAPSGLWMLGATGLLGIGFEVVAVRVLRQHAENTVFTFAMLLAAYLLGTAGGASLHARFAAGAPRAMRALSAAMALAVLASIAVLWQADPIVAHLRRVLGAGVEGGVAAEAALAMAAFAMPCVVMGALFSELATRARSAGTPLGYTLTVNMAGAALAPAAIGVVMLPVLGAKGALVAIAAGYALLALREAPRASAVALLAAGATAIAGPSLVAVDRPDGARVVRYEEGATAAVSVTEDADGVRRLRIDNRQQEGSNATLVADGRQAVLPLVLHPSPRDALFLGLGTGVTSAVAAFDPGLHVTVVELLPEVVRAREAFNAEVAAGAARLRPVVADARRFMRTDRATYDVIVADNFHPARSGSASLYTVEHFAAVRSRLAAGGLFCQWLPLHQLDLDTLRAIVRAYTEVFPEAHAVLATSSLETPVIGLVARPVAARFDAAAIGSRIDRLPRPPGALGLDAMAVLGSFAAGPESLRRFAADAPRNTDDRPIVAYAAPRITYAPDSRPADRLLAWLSVVSDAPRDFMAADDERLFERVTAYARARDAFLALGRSSAVTGDAREAAERLAPALLDIVRASPDFRPAYDPLVRIARRLALDDPGAARRLLARVDAANPARPEARLALGELAR